MTSHWSIRRKVYIESVDNYVVKPTFAGALRAWCMRKAVCDILQ